MYLFRLVSSLLLTALLATPLAFAQDAGNPQMLLMEESFQREVTAVYSSDKLGIEVVDKAHGSPEQIDTLTVEVQAEGGASRSITLTETDRESSVYHAVLQLKGANVEGEGYTVHARKKMSVAYGSLTSSLDVLGKPQLMVSPPRMYLHLSPTADIDHPAEKDILTLTGGENIDREITITNIGDEEAYFKVWTEDFYKDDHDNLVYFSQGKLPEEYKPYALSQWIGIRGSDRLLLKPNEPQVVRVRVSLPPNVPAGSRYAAVIFGEDRDPAEKTGEVLGARAEYSVLLTANLGTKADLKLTGEVKDVQLGAPNADGAFEERHMYLPWQVNASLETALRSGEVDPSAFRLPFILKAGILNTGNAAFKPQGQVTIRNLLGMPVYQDVFAGTTSAFPGIVRNYQQNFITSSGIWFGYYRVSIQIIDGQGDHLESISIPLYFATWSGSVAASAILFLIIAIVAAIFVKKQK